MKKLSSLVLVLSIICITANASYSAEYWAKTYGGSGDDYGWSIQQTTDGGYIVAGDKYSSSPENKDMWVLKLDSNGIVLWEKTYGENIGGAGRSIQQTTDGGYIVAGTTPSGTGMTSDYWLLKLDINGNISWQKTYGGSSNQESAYHVQQTTDGGYIITGNASSFGAGGRDFWVLKLDSNGGVDWQKTYGGPGSDTTQTIQQTTDGGYIAAGNAWSFGAGGSDFWVFKLDNNGNVTWQKDYGGSEVEVAYSVQQTTDEGYIVVGYTGSYGAGDKDYWVLKLDSDGGVDWQKTYGGSGKKGGRR